MSSFLDEMRPRRLLNLDDPSQHLTGRQFVVAILITAASAAFWAFIAQSRLVALMILGTQIISIWRTPSASERPFARAGGMFLWGAICAGLWLVIRKFVVRA